MTNKKAKGFADISFALALSLVRGRLRRHCSPLSLKHLIFCQNSLQHKRPCQRIVSSSKVACLLPMYFQNEAGKTRWANNHYLIPKNLRDCRISCSKPSKPTLASRELLLTGCVPVSLLVPCTNTWLKQQKFFNCWLPLNKAHCPVRQCLNPFSSSFP